MKLTQVSKSVLVLIVLLSATGAIQEAGAFPLFRNNFFNAYPDANGTRLSDLPSNGGHCGVCHYNFSGGGARNLYGQAVEANGTTVAQILAIGGLDSDNDGFTNDDEILDLLSYSNTPTFPGLEPGNLGLVSNVDTTEIENHLVPVPAQPMPIPAVSTWGVILMGLTIMAFATILWRRPVLSLS